MKPAPRETFHSFLSRVASSKGVPAPEFVADIGAAWRGAVKLEQSAVATIAEVLRLTGNELTETLSWTGVPQGNVRIRFRGEDYISRSLRNPVMRGCPCCLRADLETQQDGLPPSASMMLRGDWQLREASICLKHKHLLVPLWTEDKLSRHFDIARQFEEMVAAFIDRSLEQPKVIPTAYDIWLDSRLTTGRDGGWLADKSLHAASTVAGLLGRQILLIEGSADLDSVSAVRKAQEAGYGIISSGRDTIIRCFDTLSKGARGPAAAFGVMLARFKDLYASEASFKPFTDLLREFIADRWPSRQERVLLGEQVAASRHTSSQDVARSIRRHPSFVRNATEALRQANSASKRQADKRLSRREVEAMLDEVRVLIAGKEMMALLGVGRHEWEASRAGGFITPRLKSDKMRKIWHPDDASAFLEKLQARPMSPSASGWPLVRRAFRLASPLPQGWSAR